MSSHEERAVDVESPPDDLHEANVPLIGQTNQSSDNDDVHLDGLPSIQKPGYGNWMWAEKQCARRSGLTVGEATAIQQAFGVYQGTNDPEEFFAYVRAMIAQEMPGLIKDLSTPKSRGRLGAAFHGYMGFVERLKALTDIVVQFNPHHVSVLWGIVSLWMSRYYRERMQERQRTMEVLSKLVELFMVEHENQASSRNMPQPSRNTAEDSEAENGSTASLSGQQPRLSTLQESETIIRDKGQTPPKDTETKWRGFDTSRLDQEKFYALVHDLLRDRSRGPDGQLPDHDSSLSLFLIIGWFSGGSSDPYERQVEFKDDEHLFTRLRQEERRIRGWRVYLSLKSLSQFGLYKCDIPHGNHVRLSLSIENASTLSHLFRAYKSSRWHPDADISKAWMTWIQKNLNENKLPLEGKYSLELVYGWSPLRLSILVIFPVILSFGVGLGYMLETGDAGGAWTIASYVVTAAGAIVALLAILGSLKEH